MLNLGFIGAGNMGGALALAAAKKEGNSIFLSDRIQEKAAALAEKTGGAVTGWNLQFVGLCDKCKEKQT